VSDANLRQIRVLHIVSAGALASSLQQSLFMPLLTRLPRPRVKSLVACLSPGAVPSAILRQSGVPTYDLALSRQRFSPRAFQELQQATRNFRPDVIQAWGHTAQIISSFLRSRCDWKPQLIWSIADTIPLAKNAGLVDRQKLKYAAKFAARADRIVYSSEAAAAGHRRVGFPEGEHEMIPPGVDATRFKPDFAARKKLREQLNLPGDTFVIGMYAPFQPEYDFSTLIKAVGELIKINPNVAVVLAGHGVQKGNAPLMALVGGGALATRVHLLGEWSDISALYNACDVVCSSALNDQARMNLVMAMLCGVPCVATGMGAQGEVIAQHGVAIEPGNPSAFVKGITRVMQMTPEKRTFMAQGARKHALANYVYVRSLQKYLQLYYDLIGRQSLVTQDLPTPEVDPTLTVPPALPTEAEINASKRKPPTVADWGGDPDSLESKVSERAPEELPKWRIEQEQERTKREADLAAQVASTQTNGDVLQVFEAQISSGPAVATPMTERARGVADDMEELLSPDLLASDAPSAPRASNAPSGARKNAKTSQPATSAAPQTDAAKEAALKAARMAALQPIASAPKRPAAVNPAVAAKAAAIASMAPSVDLTMDFNSTQPVLLAAELLQTSPSPAKAEKVDVGATQRIETLTKTSAAPILATVQSPVAPVANVDSSTTEPLPALGDSTAPFEALTEADLLPALEKAPELELSLKTAAPAAPVSEKPAEFELALADDVFKATREIEPVASPLGRLAKALASAPTASATPISDVKRASSFETKASMPRPAIAEAKPSPQSATSSMTAALEKWNSSFDLGELSLMATGVWAATPRSNTSAKPGADDSKSQELSGAEALSLISKPAEELAAPTDPTLKLEVLPDPASKPKKLVVNGGP
jgi:glycosyltransferase involved in cell wall biosynthesis